MSRKLCQHSGVGLGLCDRRPLYCWKSTACCYCSKEGGEEDSTKYYLGSLCGCWVFSSTSEPPVAVDCDGVPKLPWTSLPNRIRSLPGFPCCRLEFFHLLGYQSFYNLYYPPSPKSHSAPPRPPKKPRTPHVARECFPLLASQTSTLRIPIAKVATETSSPLLSPDLRAFDCLSQ